MEYPSHSGSLRGGWNIHCSQEREWSERRWMQREQIVFVGTSDLSGHFRGKSFPASDLNARLKRGVGLAPTNIFMSAFGPIQMTTFGTLGEVFLVPDPEARVF